MWKLNQVRKILTLSVQFLNIFLRFEVVLTLMNVKTASVNFLWRATSKRKNSFTNWTKTQPIFDQVFAPFLREFLLFEKTLTSEVVYRGCLCNQPRRSIHSQKGCKLIKKSHIFIEHRRHAQTKYEGVFVE